MKNYVSSSYQLLAKGDIILQNIPVNETYKNNRTNINQIIDRIWDKENAKRDGKLHNSSILNMSEIHHHNDQTLVKGFYIDYKDFVAQRVNTNLNLGIKPLGVTGITFAKSGADKMLIFGKRGKFVTQYPESIELVPSGSIDDKFLNSDRSIDFTKNLISELYEELIIDTTTIINDIKTLGLILDKQDNVYDIVCKIELNISITDITCSNEYSSYTYVHESQLTDFIEKNINTITPSSLAAIKVYLGT